MCEPPRANHFMTDRAWSASVASTPAKRQQAAFKRSHEVGRGPPAEDRNGGPQKRRLKHRESSAAITCGLQHSVSQPAMQPVSTTGLPWRAHRPMNWVGLTPSRATRSTAGTPPSPAASPPPPPSSARERSSIAAATERAYSSKDVHSDAWRKRPTNPAGTLGGSPAPGDACAHIQHTEVTNDTVPHVHSARQSDGSYGCGKTAVLLRPLE